MFEKKVTEEQKLLEKEVNMLEKKEKKKMKRADKMGKNSLMMVLIPLVFAAIVTCLIFLFMKNQAQMETLKEPVVCAKQNISANTYVPKDEVDQYFEEKMVDATAVPGNVLKSLSELPKEGLYVESSLAEKEMVHADDVEETDTIMEKYGEATKLTSFAVDSFDHSVSGSIRHGNLVDIYALDPATEQLTLMASNVYVEDVYNNSGEKISDEGVAVAFTIRVAPEETEAINKAIVYGGIQVYLAE